MKTVLRFSMQNADDGEIFQETIDKGKNGLYENFSMSTEGASVTFFEETVLEKKDFPQEVSLSFEDSDGDTHRIYLSTDELLDMLCGIEDFRAANAVRYLLGVDIVIAAKFLEEYKEANKK